MTIEQIFESYADNGSFYGAALIADKGVVIYKQGFGLANAEWNIANSIDTVFRIGSLTKQFTSMLIFLLAGKGALSIKASISDYLPWYRTDTGSAVTIHNLLCHTSGVPTFTTMEFVQKHLRISLPVQEFVQRFCSGDLEFSPGSAFAYSNSGYHILGAIIEQITGLSFAQAISRYILNPLGMENSGYDCSEKIIPRRASGYDREERGLVNTSFVDMSIPYAGGGMYSTVEDYYTWDRALAENLLLSPEDQETMFTPVHGNYACGWGVARAGFAELDQYMQNPSGYRSQSQGLLIHRHEGGINGFHSLAVRVPESGGLVVLFSNIGEAPLTEMAVKILMKLEWNNEADRGGKGLC